MGIDNISLLLYTITVLFFPHSYTIKIPPLQFKCYFHNELQHKHILFKII